jgi:hypothetical protein
VTSRTSISAWSVAGLVVTAAALAGCGGPSGTERPAATSSSAAPAAPAAVATTTALPRATTRAQCEARPDSTGDILVRTTTNGQPAATQQLGGAWTWDTRTRTCTTAVRAVIATASPTTGNCTEVAYSSSNPGYKLTVSPAPPLKKVVAAKGPAC